MVHLSACNFDPQAIGQPGNSSSRFVERSGSDYAPWAPVCHTKDYRPAALIREGSAILCQSLEMEPGSRLLKLQTLSFGFTDEILQTCERGVLIVICHCGTRPGSAVRSDLSESYSHLSSFCQTVFFWPGTSGPAAPSGRARPDDRPLWERDWRR